MKVKLTIELELPGNPDLLGDGLEQVIFDAYLNYTTVKHLEDARKWSARQYQGTAEYQEGARRLYQYHDNWADICSRARYKVEEI